MEASGAPCREERQGGAEFAGVAERDGRAGEREGARPPCGGHRTRRCAKLSKFPQAFPDAGTRAAERANSVFVRGRAQSASGQAAPCIRAACPGSTGNGGNGVCQRRRTSALRDAYAPDKADAGEERPVRIRAGLPESGGATLVQCPVLRRIRALPVAGGGAASLARVLFRAQAVQSCGAERESVTVHGAGSELGAGPGRKQVFRLRRRILLRFVASGVTQGAQAELERPGVESRKTAGARRAEGGFADCSGRRPSRFPVFSRRGSRRVSIMSRKQPCGTGALGLRPRVPAVRRRCGRAACPALPAGSFPGTHGRRRAE